ncbi:GATOR complex protein NPRL2 [Trichonephila clavipes]|nr:GATOR complex protein NPRL2 [Trichonephila clavipes]
MSRAKAKIEESPIKCIFYSEFHHTTGPKITFQVPNDYVSKELFDSYVCYIIPKEELQRKLITVNARKGKIIGYPIHIENTKYPRNRLIFNLCFVCDPSKRTMQYEPIVRKLANYLVKLELEDEFLFKEHMKAQLPSIMDKIRGELNRSGKCSISIKVIDLPIKKWAGVKAFKSSELLDKGHSGLEFKIPSIWIQTVRNSS